MSKSPTQTNICILLGFLMFLLMVSILVHTGTDEILLNSLNVFMILENLWKYLPQSCHRKGGQ